MYKRYKISYLSNDDVRFVIAKDFRDCLNYVLNHDVAGTNQYGDTLAYGEIDTIALYDSSVQIQYQRENDELTSAVTCEKWLDRVKVIAV